MATKKSTSKKTATAASAPDFTPLRAEAIKIIELCGGNAEEYAESVDELVKSLKETTDHVRNRRLWMKKRGEYFAKVLRRGTSLERATEIMGKDRIIHPDTVVDLLGLPPLSAEVREQYERLVIPEKLLAELARPLKSSMFPDVELHTQPSLYLVPILPVTFDEAVLQKIKTRGLTLEGLSPLWHTVKAYTVDADPPPEDGFYPNWMLVREGIPCNDLGCFNHKFPQPIHIPTAPHYLYASVLVWLNFQKLLYPDGALINYYAHYNFSTEPAILTRPEIFQMTLARFSDERHMVRNSAFGAVFLWTDFQYDD